MIRAHLTTCELDTLHWRKAASADRIKKNEQGRHVGKLRLAGATPAPLACGAWLMISCVSCLSGRSTVHGHLRLIQVLFC